MKTKQNGFTLIELMIVVAIISILAAFAVPAYGDYTKRTYITEGLTLANSLKLGITEYVAVNGDNLPTPLKLTQLGVSTKPITSTAVASIAPFKGALGGPTLVSIRITFKDNIIPPDENTFSSAVLSLSLPRNQLTGQTGSYTMDLWSFRSNSRSVRRGLH